MLAFNGQTIPGTPSGGYQAQALSTYFEQVLGQRMPDITEVLVHGPGNDPGDDPGNVAQPDPADSTGEIMLDLQVVGALAPDAQIVVYFTTFDEQGWVDAINAVATDTARRPTVMSISYGNPEDAVGSAWTLGAIKTVNDTFGLADKRNISIFCASGNDGSRDQGTDLRAHADFPASSPYVTGVGGTRLVADIAGTAITSEVVGDDGPGDATGGGISRWFPVPDWQRRARAALGQPSAPPGPRPSTGKNQGPDPDESDPIRPAYLPDQRRGDTSPATR
ncbi:hypothetical protein AB5J72_38010 [Streptomyces sp. CG1]|uniref:hypothetical protein n=1 Tax=Streptomyces sp. CG1 TaxID=1287523 RepID=UPI0034E1D72E